MVWQIPHRSLIGATVFEVDVKARCTAAPGFRPVLFAIFVSAMALSAYMPASACALPGGTGQATDPAAVRAFQLSRGLGRRPASASLPAKAYEIDPGPAP
jgi:hypothetical protein